MRSCKTLLLLHALRLVLDDSGKPECLQKKNLLHVCLPSPFLSMLHDKSGMMAEEESQQKVLGFAELSLSSAPCFTLLQP